MKRVSSKYHWLIIASCFVLQFTALGLGNSSSNLYFKPICDNMGFSRAAYSTVYSILSITNMFTSLTFGIIHRKIGVRFMCLIGMISQVCGFLIYYFSMNIYMFYIGAVFMGIGLTYQGVIPASIVISNWFWKKKGIVLGVALSGSAVGGIILNPVVSKWITSYGWRMSYLISAFIVSTIPVFAILLIREKPSDIGLTPYGADKKNTDVSLYKDLEEAKDHKPTIENGEVREDAVKSGYFWFMLVATFLTGLSMTSVFNCVSVYLGDNGFEAGVIAITMSIIFFVNLVSKIILGFINDKLGVRPVVLIGHGCFIIATLILLSVPKYDNTLVFSIFFGVSGVAVAATISLLTEALFGSEVLGTMLGIMTAASTIGASVGTPLVGLLFEIYHTYVYSFVLFVFIDVIAVCLILFALKQKGLQKQGTV